MRPAFIFIVVGILASAAIHAQQAPASPAGEYETYATFPTSGGGLGVLPIPLPDSSAVGGVSLAFQAAVPGPGGGFAFTNGLVATFGY